MPAYTIDAKVDQIVTKEVQLLIEAPDQEEAERKARSVLQDYPAETEYDPMIHRIVTRKSRYWIPKSIEFVSVKEENEVD